MSRGLWASTAGASFDFDDKVSRAAHEYEVRGRKPRKFAPTRSPRQRARARRVRSRMVCKYWIRGLCTKGYEGSHDEYPPVPISWRREACEFRHEYEAESMPECQFFSRFGECSNDDCVFVHSKKGNQLPEVGSGGSEGNGGARAALTHPQHGGRSVSCTATGSAPSGRCVPRRTCSEYHV